MPPIVSVGGPEAPVCQLVFYSVLVRQASGRDNFPGEAPQLLEQSKGMASPRERKPYRLAL